MKREKSASRTITFGLGSECRVLRGRPSKKKDGRQNFATKEFSSSFLRVRQGGNKGKARGGKKKGEVVSPHPLAPIMRSEASYADFLPVPTGVKIKSLRSVVFPRTRTKKEGGWKSKLIYRRLPSLRLSEGGTTRGKSWDVQGSLSSSGRNCASYFGQRNGAGGEGEP